MVTGKKKIQVSVFSGSPWEVAVVSGLLSAACIHVNVKDEGKMMELSVPGERYSEAIRLIGNRYA